MPNPTFTYSDELVRAVMASERMLELQANATRLVDDLDALIAVAVVREHPTSTSVEVMLEIDAGLTAEARRRLAEEVAGDA